MCLNNKRILLADIPYLRRIRWYVLSLYTSDKFKLRASVKKLIQVGEELLMDYGDQYFITTTSGTPRAGGKASRAQP